MKELRPWGDLEIAKECRPDQVKLPLKYRCGKKSRLGLNLPLSVNASFHLGEIRAKYVFITISRRILEEIFKECW